MALGMVTVFRDQLWIYVFPEPHLSLHYVQIQPFDQVLLERELELWELSGVDEYWERIQPTFKQGAL